MPPSPERGSWPVETASPPDPFAVEDVYDWTVDDYRYDGLDDDRHRGSTYADPWDADPEEMDYVAGPETEPVPQAYQEDHTPGVNGAAPWNDEPPPRDYEDYFDDDEDDLEGVETTSEATRNALEWAVVLVGAVLVALLLRASLFQAFWIPSESMETTLLTNDRVLVNKVSYRLHDINRGDIVVFERPDDEPGAIRDLIKRVIALPGETVEARDGSIFINGQRLVEPYLDEGVITDDFSPTVVPEGEIFVMGDNRGNSQDSRWFGTVSEERVVGRAFVLFWPIGRVGSL
jgi:signal peptidase I